MKNRELEDKDLQFN